MMMAQRTGTSWLNFRLLMLAFALAAALLATACGSEVEKATVGSKSAANETAAIGALRAVASAQAIYSTTHEGDYGTFEELVKAGQLDARFSGSQPVVGGYVLTMKVAPKDTGAGQPPSYAVNADPQQNVAAASTGNRHFYLDSSGVIHVNAKQAAAAGDSPL
jgi:hypothetical protein